MSEKHGVTKVDVSHLENKAVSPESTAPISSMPELEQEMQKLKDMSPQNSQAIDALQSNANKGLMDETYDPMAGALTLFGLYGPQLFSLIDRMSVRQLKRFSKALVTYPLENIEINKKDPVQVEAYKIADRMITSKYLLILTTAFEEKQRQEMAQKEYLKTQEEAKKLAESEGASTEVPKTGE